jgi:glycosyltransferase involved in cell wall biosynthesis
MKISYLHGICVHHDAISRSIYDEISWLKSCPDNDVRLFTYACDYEDIPYKVVKDINDVAFDPFFQQSDMVIFHFGVYYPLFNLLFIAPENAKKIVVFHNITPKEYLPSKDHETIDKSFQQLSNITFADHIICVSYTNQEVLTSTGIHAPIKILPLALHGQLQAPLRKPSFTDGITRIIFIGRFVQSKGPTDLLTALSVVMEDSKSEVLEISFLGNINFSDQNVINEIQSKSNELQKRYSNRLIINLYGNADEDKKNMLLAQADIFVLPTRHEGFCVPILEAFQSACQVISYDNSNVPSISGGFAKLVPTGDIQLLAQELKTSINDTRSEDWIANGGYEKYCSELAQYCKKYHPENVRQKFLSTISAIYRNVSY